MAHYIDILWHLISIFYDTYSLYPSKKSIPNKSVAVSQQQVCAEDHRPSLAVVLSSAFKWKKWDLVSWPWRHSHISFTDPFLYFLGVDQYVFIIIYASPRHYLHTVFNLRGWRYFLMWKQAKHICFSFFSADIPPAGCAEKQSRSKWSYYAYSLKPLFFGVLCVFWF